MWPRDPTQTTQRLDLLPRPPCIILLRHLLRTVCWKHLKNFNLERSSIPRGPVFATRLERNAEEGYFSMLETPSSVPPPCFCNFTMRSSSLKMAQDGSKMAQDGRQDGFKTAQHDLKMGLKMGQMALRWPNTAPRWPQHGPKEPQDDPKMVPRSLKRAQDSPGYAQQSSRGSEEVHQYP